MTLYVCCHCWQGDEDTALQLTPLPQPDAAQAGDDQLGVKLGMHVAVMALQSVTAVGCVGKQTSSFMCAYEVVL